MIVKNDLYDYENRYIFQDDDMFKFSVDSILLAEYANKFLKKANNILDMCSGNMAASLILSKYTAANITGFEIQKEAYNLGVESIKINNLQDSLSIINDDVNNINQYFSNDFFDLMICNPPFFKKNSSILNDSNYLVLARHEVKFTIEDIFKIAKSFLKNSGSVIIVHRASRLDEIIKLGYKYQVNVKEIQFVSTKKGKKPTIVLIRAVKNSNEGVIINSELCIENVKSYKNIFKELS